MGGIGKREKGEDEKGLGKTGGMQRDEIDWIREIAGIKAGKKDWRNEGKQMTGRRRNERKEKK